MTCDAAGPGKCDMCQRGYTLDKVTGDCAACAPHCYQCDASGPGTCSECGPRRMLHVRLEVHGEVHECLSCGPGCRECNEEEGCVECDSVLFYDYLEDGLGCRFSWPRLIFAVGLVVAAIIGCAIINSDGADTS